MKLLRFPAQSYTLITDEVQKDILGREVKYTGYKYDKQEDSIISSLELAWNAVTRSQLQDLNKKDHKLNKALKKKLREVTRFKDKDEDSRIPLKGEQILYLEEAELELLKRHLDEGNKFTSAVSEDVDRLWEVIESAQDYDPKKDLSLLAPGEALKEG